MDSYQLSGDYVFNGSEDMIAGDDLGFLPFLASAIAPRLAMAALPLAQRALARSGVASRITRAASSSGAQKLARSVRLPKPMAQRAIQSISEGASPAETFVSTFSSPENAEEESEKLGALNADNPLSKILSFVRSKLPFVDDKTKTAITTTATNVLSKPVTQNQTKPQMRTAMQTRFAKTPTKGTGLAKIANVTPTSNQALIAKPTVNPYTMPQTNPTSSSGGSGAGGNWDYTVNPNVVVNPSYSPSQNLPSSASGSGMFDDDNFLLMMLFSMGQRKRRKRRYRGYRRYSSYRPYRSYRRAYRPYRTYKKTYRRY
jgi:hypothetical protein